MVQILNEAKVTLENGNKKGLSQLGDEGLLLEVGQRFKKLIDHFVSEEFVKTYQKDRLGEIERGIKLKRYQRDKKNKNIVELKKDFMNQYLDRVKGILTEQEFAKILETANGKKMKLEQEIKELRETELLLKKKRELIQEYSKEYFTSLTQESLDLFVDQIIVNEKENDSIEVIVRWNI